MSTKALQSRATVVEFQDDMEEKNPQHSSALCITSLTKHSKTVLLIWFILVKWKIPVRWWALPEHPHWSIFLFFQNSSSFTLAQSFLKYRQKILPLWYWMFQSYRAYFLLWLFEIKWGTEIYHVRKEGYKLLTKSRLYFASDTSIMKKTTTYVLLSLAEVVPVGWKDELCCSLCWRALVLQHSWGCCQERFWTPQEYFLPATWQLFVLGRAY